MTERGDPFAASRYTPLDSYSPQRRTALVLTGTGADGAYHAGVLRALHEAGVKIDLIGARGVGVVGALFAAVDGAQRLWEEHGFWRSVWTPSLYGWRRIPKLIAWALALSLAIVVLPLALAAAGLIVFPIDFVLKMIGAGGAPAVLDAYLRTMQAAFAPEALPTWLPRLVLLVLGFAGVVALASGWMWTRRHHRGAPWWQAVRGPISSTDIVERCWQVLWDLIRGAASVKAPSRADLGRRYTEMLAENIGQPGFRELLVVVHDVDAHRDLLFALVAESRRSHLVRRSTTEAAEARRAEVFDLSGVARDHLADAVAAALTLPLASEWHTVTFPAEGYWRGETHRLCDRPASLIRLVDELIDLGAEQMIVVSAAPQTLGPHALAAARLDGRGRLGDYLQSSEAAVVSDATNTTGGVRIFTIRPAHNPIGPFDFGGGYDDRSHRRFGVPELVNAGYEDAYHQFIEPVVGASGETVSSRQSSVASQSRQPSV